MVVVGFKAKFSAIMLVLILSIFNLYVNNWWTLTRASSSQGLCEIRLLPDSFHCVSDQRSDCAQLWLTIASGGLLLLVNMGPGQFSVDEKKKVY